MPRRATGTILEKESRHGQVVRALRFSAYGKRRYITLGSVTHADAERELQRILTEVERGNWRPAQSVEPADESVSIPDFRALAEEWWLRTAPLIAPSTQRGYRWRLERHLLPYFADMRLDRITPDAIERYIAIKLSEHSPLSGTSINMTVTLLGAILDGAVERDLIARNPARRAPRVHERVAQRTHLETAAQIQALLDAASDLDRGAPSSSRHIERRAMLTTLTFAGLRLGELCALRWRDVDLASGWLTIDRSTSEAGGRRVRMRGVLADELRVVRARNPQASPDAFVFPTRSHGPHDAHNFRARVLHPTIARANAKLTERGLAPLPERITLHSLRRTFAYILCVLGEEPGVIMDDLGHTDPGLTLSMYRHAVKLAPQEKARLRVLLEGARSPWLHEDSQARVTVADNRQPASRSRST